MRLGRFSYAYLHIYAYICEICTLKFSSHYYEMQYSLENSFWKDSYNQLADSLE